MTHHATIEYDNEHLTQPYVIMVDGVEFDRCNTYAKAESTLRWHETQGTLPVAAEEIVESHISQVDEQTNDIEKVVYNYHSHGKYVCDIELDFYSGLWFNGDGKQYKDWRDAGRAYQTYLQKHKQAKQRQLVKSAIASVVLIAALIPSIPVFASTTSAPQCIDERQCGRR